MNLYRICLTVLLILFFPAATFAAEKSYNQIIFFGDSLTDNGNLYRADLKLFPQSPPYFEGRFSNGWSWAEYVAQDYVQENISSQNYAVGGETAYFHNPFGGYLPYTISESISGYLLSAALTDKSHTLFVIWIGSNDYLQGAVNIDEATTSVVQAIKTNIETLLAYGAKKFLILNLPDLAKTPHATKAGTTENLHALAMMNNEKLATMVAEIQKAHTESELRLFDLNQVFTTLVEHPEVYNEKYQTHITNTTQACWPEGFALRNNSEAAIASELAKGNSLALAETANQLAKFISASPDLAAAYEVSHSYSVGVTPCSNPDEYIFWDQLHPAAVIHRILGKVMVEFIDQNYA